MALSEPLVDLQVLFFKIATPGVLFFEQIGVNLFQTLVLA